MNPAGEQILTSLQCVAAQRQQRRQDPALGRGVQAIKAYQHARFMNTYADMLAHPRYGGAALFFLEDLYGPGDFTSRDDQFARIVPGLVRMFPKDIIATVQCLGQLHALSEELDTAMAAELAPLKMERALFDTAISPADPGPEIEALAARWRRANGPLMSLVNGIGGKIENRFEGAATQAALTSRAAAR